MKLTMTVLGVLLLANSVHAADETRGVKAGLFGYGLKFGVYGPGKTVVPADPSGTVPTFTAPAPEPTWVATTATTNPVVQTVAAPAPAVAYQAVAVTPVVQPPPAPPPVVLVGDSTPVSYPAAQAQPTYTWAQQAHQAPVSYAQNTSAQQQNVQPAQQVTVTRIYPVRTTIYVASR